MENVYLVTGSRTAIGSFGGGFQSVSPVDLGTTCVKQLLTTSGSADHIDLVVMGTVLSAGHGQNIARQISVNAGIRHHVPSFTVNQVCGSGLQSILLGMQAIQTGQAQCVVAGGAESMSTAAHLLPGYRWGKKMGNQTVLDSMIVDGLWDAFNDVHMGITAENVAQKWSVSRRAQDAFAFHSHRKASQAQKQGVFTSEIVPFEVVHKKKTVMLDQDESIRHDIQLEKLAGLRPVFASDGVVTAGNASSLNDGAAAVLLVNESMLKQLDIDASFSIKYASSVGYDPALMGAAPIDAIRDVIKKASITLDDIDLFEINEAFAAQSIAVQQELGIPDSRLNVNGGAIALGHPIGASGARIMVTLMHEMNRRQSRTGLASLCIGGGQAVAMIVDQV